MAAEANHQNDAVDAEEGNFWETRIVGDYEYKRLCMPRLNPWKKENNDPLPYYGKILALPSWWPCFLVSSTLLRSSEEPCCLAFSLEPKTPLASLLPT